VSGDEISGPGHRGTRLPYTRFFSCFEFPTLSPLFKLHQVLLLVRGFSNPLRLVVARPTAPPIRTSSRSQRHGLHGPPASPHALGHAPRTRPPVDARQNEPSVLLVVPAGMARRTYRSRAWRIALVLSPRPPAAPSLTAALPKPRPRLHVVPRPSPVLPLPCAALPLTARLVQRPALCDSGRHSPPRFLRARVSPARPAARSPSLLHLFSKRARESTPFAPQSKSPRRPPHRVHSVIQHPSDPHFHFQDQVQKGGDREAIPLSPTLLAGGSGCPPLNACPSGIIDPSLALPPHKCPSQCQLCPKNL
jgi:hypothetical protein